jgi:hypothetical protein
MPFLSLWIIITRLVNKGLKPASDNVEREMASSTSRSLASDGARGALVFGSHEASARSFMVFVIAVMDPILCPTEQRLQGGLAFV